MEQRDNIKYILLDVWETLLLSNIREKNINNDRANILLSITQYGNIEFWRDTIENEILRFKKKELKGISITPKERIENILKSNNLSIKFTEKILEEYDSLITEKYIPNLNEKLLNQILQKKCDIILISNTGLTTKRAILKILEKYNLINKFKDMFFSQDYKYCKPSIYFYMIPLNLYKINKNEIIMYGDSKIMDLEPCNKLGIDCIIKNWRNL